MVDKTALALTVKLFVSSDSESIGSADCRWWTLFTEQWHGDTIGYRQGHRS